MFSGKTEELIRRLKRAKFARQRVEIFKPAIDTRYSEEEVVSHDSNSIASTPIDSSASILLFSSDKDVVGIDFAVVTVAQRPAVTHGEEAHGMCLEAGDGLHLSGLCQREGIHVE